MGTLLTLWLAVEEELMKQESSKNKRSKITIWILAFLVFAVGLLDGSSLNAQILPKQFTPVEVFQIEWGNDNGQIGLLKVPGRNYGPQSFAVDEGNGKIYILDSTNQYILIYNLSGTLLSSIPISKRSDDLCLGDQENLYILYKVERKVVKYDLNGTVIATYPLIDTKSPVTGICFINEKGLFFETADGTSYPLIENGVKVSLETQNQQKILGLPRNNDRFFLERKNTSQGIIRILDFKGKTKKEIPVLKKEQNIETLSLIGIDNEKNIYLVVEESANSLEVKRYLRKYDREGVLLAEALIPYSNYVYTLRDLGVTKTGKVYQVLPLKKHVKVLMWTLNVAKSGLLGESFDKLFFYTFPRPENFLPGDPIDIDTEQSEVEKQLFFSLYSASISQNEIISRAESYRSHTFYVDSSNITTSGVNCDTGGVYSGGKIVKTPVCSSGWYTGVLYKWGGFTGLTGITSYTDVGYFYDEGLTAGKYSGDKCTAYDPDCSGIYYGSSNAVGVDCSGFVSQTWGLSYKENTTGLTYISCQLPSKENLLEGDILDFPGTHVMLFAQREPDGRYTVYEASGWDWKVSDRSYYSYELNSYNPYRYKNLSGMFQIGDRIQTISNLNVRTCASTSCSVIATEPTGAQGTIVNGPQTGDGYTWWQIGYDDGITGWSVQCYLEIVTGTAPPPPTGVSATDGTYTDRVRVTWNVSSGATSYEVYRATSSGGTKSQIGTPSGTSYDDYSASVGTTYYYWVKAKNSYGTSGYSSYNTGYRAGTAPPAPTNVSATDGTYTDKVRITWNPSSGATSYEVYRATSSGGTKSKIGTPSGTSYDDTSASVGTTYYYWVKAKNTYGTSGYSSYNTGYRAGTAPPAPTNVSATDGTYTDKVRITWSASSGATSYEVYRATSSGGTKSQIGTPTGTYYDDTSASVGTTYYYWVKAKNTYGTSGYSSYNTGYRAGSAPPAPTNVSATDGTYTDKVRITWSASSGATSYEVYRATSSGGTKSKIGTPSGTSYDDYSASVGTTYYYWVKAKNSYGTSGYSSYNTGYRQEDTAITVTSPNGGESWQPGTSHSITWTSSGNVGSYVKIELYKGGSFNRTITSSTTNDDSYTWTVPSTQTTGTDYKIEITSTTNSSYYDDSDSYFSITSETSIYDWPMFHYDTANTGYSPDTNVPAQVEEVWRYYCGGGYSPAIADGVVYFGAANMAGDDVIALDEETGLLIWSYNFGGSAYVSATAPAVDNGSVYVTGASDSNSNGTVYSFEAATGYLNWSYSIGDYIFKSSPKPVDGKVYFGTSDNKVYCLNANDGSLVWNYGTASSVSSTPAVVNGILYIGSNDQKIYALNANTGNLIWSYDTGNDGYGGSIQNAPAVANGKVYFRSGNDFTYCLNANNGSVIWKTETSGGQSSVAIAYGNVYIADYEGTIYCLDVENGSIVWSYDAEINIASSPVVANNVLYIVVGGDYGADLIALNASNGAFIWTIDIGNRSFISSVPAIANGRIFVADKDSYLYAFGTAPPDIIPPDTFITGGPSGTITNNDVTFNYAGSDNVTSTSNLVYSYKLDGYDSTWSNYTFLTSKSYNDLSNSSYTFYVKAKDEAGNVDPSAASRSFTVNVSSNHDPDLTSGDVDPNSGNTSTTFTYTVHYYDQDGDSPSTRYVYIDGSPHTMSLISGSASNGTYRYQTTLSSGSHNYYFYFTDGQGGSDRLPSSGSYSGPSVSAPDTTPPTPNPMTWATQPYPAGSTSISMVATTAIDSESSPVSYSFDFVNSPTGGSGGSDLGWQSSMSYTDTGLQPNHQYGYRVKARDSASTPNETDYSSTVYKYTHANAPGTSSFSNVTQTSIQANWTVNGNPAGTQYYCENTTAGANSGWTTNTYWNSAGLTCGTSYTFRVKARNGDGTQTGWTNLGSQSTQTGPSPPTVATTPVSSITENSASSGGNVTSNGGASVTARGVCWSTSANPTTSDSHTSDGTGTGSFTSSISSLLKEIGKQLTIRYLTVHPILTFCASTATNLSTKRKKEGYTQDCFTSAPKKPCKCCSKILN
jgi:outer membrane protein assembly factor BamB